MSRIDLPHLNSGGGIITDDKRHVYAECHTVDVPLPKAAAVANEIAFRCNVHKELVEALRELVGQPQSDVFRRIALEVLAKVGR